MSSELLEAAQHYLSLGWCPLPVPYREKGPKVFEWPKLRLKAEELPRHFRGEMNIGVNLGVASAGLCDIDLDCDEAVELAPAVLPPTWTFGRASNPRSHWIYVAPGALTEKFTCPETNKTLVELRATPTKGENKEFGGSQTVFPPSTHVSGEPIQWTEDADGTDAPLAMLCGDLRARVVELAIACVIQRLSPPGSLLLYLQQGLLPRLSRDSRQRIDQWRGAVAASEGETFYRPQRKHFGRTLGPGSRNEGLFHVGCAMRAQGASLSDLEIALEQENHARCVPPLSPRELKDLCHSISRYPAGGARP